MFRQLVMSTSGQREIVDWSKIIDFPLPGETYPKEFILENEEKSDNYRILDFFC